MLATPLTISVGSVGAYFALSMKKEIPKEEYETETGDPFGKITGSSKSVYDKYKIFPEITQEEFYDKIIIRNGVAEINNQMIESIFNYIFDHMQIAEGDIGWNYMINSSRTELFIYVRWYSIGKEYDKTYKINLIQNK